MSTQTKAAALTCDKVTRGQACGDPATVGVYRWHAGESDVNLDQPEAVRCARHAPKHNGHQSMLRNVKLRTS